MNTKKLIKLSISALIVLLAFAPLALAKGFTIPEPTAPSDQKATQLVGSVLGFIKFAAIAIALGMLLIIGIKYITASPDGKADIKQTAIHYLFGAVCIFASGLILGAIQSLIENAGGK